MSYSLTEIASDAALSINGRKTEKSIFLDGERLPVKDSARVPGGEVKVGCSESSRREIASARKFVEEKSKTGTRFYGIDTGFGRLADVSVALKQLAGLRSNLIRSHRCAAGNPVSSRETRTFVPLRANDLAKAPSGVRPMVIESLLEMLKRRLLPPLLKYNPEINTGWQ